MSYVNGTQHYNLPQTVGTDKRDWADTNQAFADVDAALYQAVETAGDASTAVAALDAQVNGTGGVVERVSAAENDIDTVEASVATLQTTVANHTSQIADVRRDDQDMITAFNEPDATSDHAYSVGDYFIYNDILYKATASIAVGATIVPNTNCAATNVTTEIKDNVVDISGKQDKTDNSLTTTSKQVVGAINELNSDLPTKLNKPTTISYTSKRMIGTASSATNVKVPDPTMQLLLDLGYTISNIVITSVTVGAAGAVTNTSYSDGVLDITTSAVTAQDSYSVLVTASYTIS